MSARTATSWQTSLADLSLILFMLMAAALAHRPVPPRTEAKTQPARPDPAPPQAPSAQGEPLALYIAAPGAPPLARWLESQPRDPRQQLTVTLAYGPGAEAKALETAAALVREQGGSLASARIVIEPGPGLGVAPLRAALAFDAPPVEAQSGQSPPMEARPGVARSLRRAGEQTSHGRPPR